VACGSAPARLKELVKLSSSADVVVAVGDGPYFVQVQQKGAAVLVLVQDVLVRVLEAGGDGGGAVAADVVVLAAAAVVVAVVVVATAASASDFR